jgi:hypothetical protein
MFSPNRTRENGIAFDAWIAATAFVALISAKPSTSSSCSALSL